MLPSSFSALSQRFSRTRDTSPLGSRSLGPSGHDGGGNILSTPRLADSHGNNNRERMSTKAVCQVKSHLGNPIELDAPTSEHVGLIKVGATKPHIMAQPLIKCDAMDPKLLSAWKLRTPDTLEGWTAQFQRKETEGRPANKLWSPLAPQTDPVEPEVHNGFNLWDKVTPFQNLRTSPTTERTSVSTPSTSTLSPSVGAPPGDFQYQFRFSSVDTRSDENPIGLIVQAINETGHGLEGLSTATATSLGSIRRDLLVLRHHQASEEGRMTRVLHPINSAVNELSARFQSLPPFENIRRGLESRLTTLERNYKLLEEFANGQIKPTVVKLHHHVANLLADVQHIRGSPTGHGLSLGPLHSPSGTETELLQRLEAVEKILADPSFATFAADLAVLKATVTQVSQGSSAEAPTFAGVHFPHAEAACDFVRAHFATPGDATCALLACDPGTLYYQLAAEKDDDLKAMKLRDGLGIASAAEQHALMALRVPIPPQFHVGIPLFSPGIGQSSLNQLTSHDDWNAAGKGVKEYLAHSMQGLVDRLNAELKRGLPGDADATVQKLASSILQTSVIFVKELEDLMTSMYQDLKMNMEFTDDRAWALTTRCVYTMLADINKPKTGMFSHIHHADRVHMVGNVLFVTLQVMQNVQAYLRHGLSRHPAITGEYVRFLTLQSGRANNLSSLKSEVGELAALAKRVGGKADGAVTKVEKWEAKFKEMQTQITNVARKVNKRSDNT